MAVTTVTRLHAELHTGQLLPWEIAVGEPCRQVREADMNEGRRNQIADASGEIPWGLNRRRVSKIPYWQGDQQLDSIPLRTPFAQDGAPI